MIVTREDLESSLAAIVRDVRNPGAGLFGPSSMVWKLGGDLGVFLGGGRAALLQLAHPMVAHAIDHHSRTRADVVGRFQRTFRHIFAMTFGELDDALHAARRVHHIHARVHGEISEAIGGFAAGTRYHANDAEALRWVHATLVDTTIAVRQRLGARLTTGDLDRYTQEMNRFAALFGIPAALLPASWAEHEAYMARMIPTLAIAPCAREMAAFLIGRADPVQPAHGRVTEALAAAMLPRALVEQFELRPAAAAVRVGLAIGAPLYRRLPGSMIAIPAHAAATRRLAGRPPRAFTAWVERKLFGVVARR
jgi:uncharacterized protein (DUF2236 family)